MQRHCNIPGEDPDVSAGLSAQGDEDEDSIPLELEALHRALDTALLSPIEEDPFSDDQAVEARLERVPSGGEELNISPITIRTPGNGEGTNYATTSFLQQQQQQQQQPQEDYQLPFIHVLNRRQQDYQLYINAAARRLPPGTSFSQGWTSLLRQALQNDATASFLSRLLQHVTMGVATGSSPTSIKSNNYMNSNDLTPPDSPTIPIALSPGSLPTLPATTFSPGSLPTLPATTFSPSSLSTLPATTFSPSTTKSTTDPAIPATNALKLPVSIHRAGEVGLLDAGASTATYPEMLRCLRAVARVATQNATAGLPMPDLTRSRLLFGGRGVKIYVPPLPPSTPPWERPPGSNRKKNSAAERRGKLTENGDGGWEWEDEDPFAAAVAAAAAAAAARSTADGNNNTTPDAPDAGEQSNNPRTFALQMGLAIETFAQIHWDRIQRDPTFCLPLEDGRIFPTGTGWRVATAEALELLEAILDSCIAMLPGVAGTPAAAGPGATVTVEGPSVLDAEAAAALLGGGAASPREESESGRSEASLRGSSRQGRKGRTPPWLVRGGLGFGMGMGRGRKREVAEKL